MDYAFEQSRTTKLVSLLSCSFWKCQNFFAAPNIATNYQSSELVDAQMVSQHRNDTMIATNVVKTERFPSFTGLLLISGISVETPLHW
jgi:hypothetical protein